MCEYVQVCGVCLFAACAHTCDCMHVCASVTLPLAHSPLPTPLFAVDCGDAVLVADILLYQESLKILDLSFNRVGARGMIRMCQVLKLHKSLVIFKANHNRYFLHFSS